MSRKKKPTNPLTTATPETALSRGRVIWPYVVLGLLAFAVYANSLANGFVVDDNGQILRNPLVTDYHRIPEIFSEDVWSFSHPELGAQSNYYRPVHTLLSMALYYIAGFNAFFFHLAMVLINVANTLLVFRIAQYFFRRLPQPRIVAMIAAALFAVHPIHDEAVAWIAVMPDVFITMLALTMLALFIHHEASPRGLQLLPYAPIFLVAMLTKETSATILPLLAAFEWICLGRSVRDILKNIAFYALLVATFCVYLAMRLHALGSLAPAQGGHFSIHGAQLALSMIVLMGQYFWRLLVPTNLNYFHVFEPTRSVNLAVIVSALAIIGVVAAIFKLRRTQPLIAYGLFFIVVPLLPVMNINGVGENVFTERYLYLPSVGFVWIAALAWEWLYERNRNAAWTVFTVVAVLGSYMAIVRTADWRSDFTINMVTAQQSPQVAVVHLNLGAFLGQQGHIAEGIAECRKAIARLA